MSERKPFDWLARGSRCRRSALRDTQAAIRRGQLDGPAPELVARRAALLEVLSDLLADPLTPPREWLRGTRLIAIMLRRDQDKQIRDLKDTA